MTTTDNFPEIKQEILRRAHEARACKEQYGRACKSETMTELCQVIKDNFWWACNHKVIDCELLEKFKEAFAEHDIFVNVSVERGYLLCDSATVKAWGSATVEAWGSATVEAWGSATVKAYDSATVKACDSATVKACDSATVEAWGSATVKAWGSATVEAWGSATVEAWGSATVKAYDSATVKACDSATVKACDSATVKAWGSAYCTSYLLIECKLSDNALYRVRSTNTVYYANDSIKFQKL